MRKVVDHNPLTVVKASIVYIIHLDKLKKKKKISLSIILFSVFSSPESTFSKQFVHDYSPYQQSITPDMLPVNSEGKRTKTYYNDSIFTILFHRIITKIKHTRLYQKIEKHQEQINIRT